MNILLRTQQQFEQDVEEYNKYKQKRLLLNAWNPLEFDINKESKSIILRKAYPNANGVYIIPPFVSSYCTNCFAEVSCKNLTVINKYNRFVTMDCLFLGASSETINLDSFDTTGCFSMRAMFSQCKYLKRLNLSHFNTVKVNNLSFMFTDCGSLEQVNLRSFKTGRVMYLQYMFYNCYSLKEIDLSSFRTSNLKSALQIFDNCNTLKEVNLSNAILTEKVYNEIIDSCKLKDLQVRKILACN